MADGVIDRLPWYLLDLQRFCQGRIFLRRIGRGDYRNYGEEHRSRNLFHD